MAPIDINLTITFIAVGIFALAIGAFVFYGDYRAKHPHKAIHK